MIARAQLPPKPHPVTIASQKAAKQAKQAARDAKAKQAWEAWKASPEAKQAQAAKAAKVAEAKEAARRFREASKACKAAEAAAMQEFNAHVADAQEILGELFKASWVITTWTRLHEQARAELSELARLNPWVGSYVDDFLNSEETDARRFAAFVRRQMRTSQAARQER